MYKRILDGPGVWRSDKIAIIEPEWIRAEYANWIPLAMANGVFECSPRRIWSEIYSYNRPAITPEIVELEILPAFQRVALIFTWVDEYGKQWGYFIGIDKPGRLPGQSRRGRNEAVGPEPPAEELRKFLESNGIQKLLGLGSGLGSGSGTGTGAGSGRKSEAKASDAPRKPARHGKKTHEASPYWKDALNLSGFLASLIVRNTPDHSIAEVRVREQAITRWAGDLEKLLRLDEKKLDRVREVIQFSQDDSFWKKNILGGSKLREKYDQLLVAMNNGKGKGQNNGKSRTEKRTEKNIQAARSILHDTGQVDGDTR